MLKHRKELEKVKAYPPGNPVDSLKDELGVDRIIKMSFNENPHGTSPKVKDAVIKELEQGISQYPDGNANSLRDKLAEKFSIEKENILLANGGDVALQLIALAYIKGGDQVITSTNSFSRYIDASNIQGGEIIQVPMKDHKIDLDRIVNDINDQTKLIWLCNPNNPTGTFIKEEEILEFFDRVPDDVVIVYDEAYGEFINRKHAPQYSTKYFKKYPNVITLKTFSKIYGLAGIRVGYIIGDRDVIDIINRVRSPFNVTRLSLAAAEGALDDEDFVEYVYRENIKGREYLVENLEKIGFSTIDSETNFIYFSTTPIISPEKLQSELKMKGIFIRSIDENFCRVSIGTMEENEIFIREIIEILKRQ